MVIVRCGAGRAWAWAAPPETGRAGFSLVEVTVATMVLSMMMLAFIGFITYGSETFRRGKGKLDTVNYARIVYDLFKDEMSLAERVYQADPAAVLWGGSLTDTLTVTPPNNETSSFFYIRNITNTRGHTSAACFRISLDAPSRCLFRETWNTHIRDGKLADFPTLPKDFERKRWAKTRLARNVRAFKVVRRRQQSFQVVLEFGEDTTGDGVLDMAVSSHTMILLAPQLVE